MSDRKLNPLRRLGAGIKRLLGGKSETAAPPASESSHSLPDDHWQAEDYVAAESETQAFDPWEPDVRQEPLVEAEAEEAALEQARAHTLTGETKGTAAPRTTAIREPSEIVVQPPDAVLRESGPDAFSEDLLRSVGDEEPEPEEELIVHAPEEDVDDWDSLEEAEEDLASLDEDVLDPLPEADLDWLEEDDVADVEELEDADQLSIDDDFDDEDPVSADGFGDFDLDSRTYADFDVDLADFEPDARQDFAESSVEEESNADRRAALKAAAIASQLDLSSGRERHAAVAWLTELFQHLTHGATYRAIGAAVERGANLHDLRRMVALRNVWVEHPEWWMGRYGPAMQLSGLRHGPSALTWVLAQKICRLRSDYPPDAMIDPEWLDEWLVLPSGALGYLSFPQYIDERVSRGEAAALVDGLRLEAGYADPRELADDWNWYRKVPNVEPALRIGFRILTPFDDGPENLGRRWAPKVQEPEEQDDAE